MESLPYEYIKEPGLELGISDPKARALDTHPGPMLGGRGVRVAVTQRLSKVWQCSLRQGSGWGDLAPPVPIPGPPGSPHPFPFLSLTSSHLGPEGALSLGQALDGCPHMEEIR